MTSVTKGLLKMLGLTLVISLALMLLAKGCADSAQKEELLPVYIRHDPLTGCQYVFGAQGGIHPRVNAQGKHICALKEQK